MTTPAANSPEPDAPIADVDRLLERMRDGDRDAAAHFITTYGSRIRRRIRSRLGAYMRRVFDSQEILSTLSRRLDMYVRNGRLDVVSEAQLWSLVNKMADHAVIDKARVFRRLHAVEDSDGEFARQLLRRLEDAERERTDGFEIEIERALRVLPDEVDRQILSSWLVGTPHTETAILVDLAPTAVRKRWEKIKKDLRRQIETGAL